MRHEGPPFLRATVWNGHVTHRSQGPSLLTDAEGVLWEWGTWDSDSISACPPCLPSLSLPEEPGRTQVGRRSPKAGLVGDGPWWGGDPWGLHRPRQESSSSAVSTPGRFQERTSRLSPGPGKHSACWAERPLDEKCQRRAFHL